MILDEWARSWGINPGAVDDLRARLVAGTGGPPPGSQVPGSEAEAQQRVRLAASRRGGRLWRNNVGAVRDSRGNFVRYGLANDSRAMNAQIKSSDLVGIQPVIIAPQHVGQVFGRFVAREVKAPGWTYRGGPRETAQLRFIELVAALGGDAAFTTGED